MTRILLISGNTRPSSLHTAALRTAARHAPADVTATLFDGLRDVPAFMVGETKPPGAVTLLRQQIATADALLFSTPEFAGSIPGSLKNLLDWLVDGGDLTGKPVAWLSVTHHGQDDGARATLETVLDHGNARLLKHACVRLPLDPLSVDEQGLVADPQLHVALQDVVHALVRALDVPKPKQQPSWQHYSSVFPIVPRPDRTAARAWQHPNDGIARTPWYP
jgi:chromate reductase, NAD(P)H dehydrogenase (quinone)